MVAALSTEKFDPATADAIERLNDALARESREHYRANAARLHERLGRTAATATSLT